MFDLSCFMLLKILPQVEKHVSLFCSIIIFYNSMVNVLTSTQEGYLECSNQEVNDSKCNSLSNSVHRMNYSIVLQISCLSIQFEDFAPGLAHMWYWPVHLWNLQTGILSVLFHGHYQIKETAWRMIAVFLLIFKLSDILCWRLLLCRQ